MIEMLQTRTKTLPLARNGVFHTVQGEGYLSGLPMVFIRLAGCSVGCQGCDTDYRVSRRESAEGIVADVKSLLRPATRWVWITGGEPTDHDLTQLYAGLRTLPRVSIALATSGVRAVRWPRHADHIAPDFLSVSPHSLDKWVQRSGNEVKLVFGLDGLKPSPELEAACGGFPLKFVSPEVSRKGVADPSAVRACVDWVGERPLWRMDAQSHRIWGLA